MKNPPRPPPPPPPPAAPPPPPGIDVPLPLSAAMLLFSIDIVRLTVSRPVISLLLLLISALYVVNDALIIFTRANIAVAAAAVQLLALRLLELGLLLR